MNHEDVSVLFQPLINLSVSGVIAVEALARCECDELSEGYQQAARHDVQLASFALQEYAKHDVFPRLHLNLLASTVASDLGELEVLRESLRRCGRREHDITLELGPPVHHLDFEGLLSGIEYLRGCGFRITLDGLGEADFPPTLVSDMRPESVKLQPPVVRDLPDRRGRLGVLEAVQSLCHSTGSDLVVDGVTDERQLALLDQHGVRLVQGDLLTAPATTPWPRGRSRVPAPAAGPPASPPAPPGGSA